jgi:hypothetical protein
MRRLLLACGVLAMGYAVVGSVADLGGKIGGVLLFLVAVLVVHDAVWLPVVLLAGRWIRRPAARVAAIVAAAVTVTALPLALGLGRTADNPSALPLNYPRNLALILIGVAVVAAVARVFRRPGSRKDSTTGRPRPSR